MGRKALAPKREILPDPKYGSVLVARFINCLMHDGKKSVAESILYDALDIVSKKLHKNPLEVFEKALENVKPVLEVKSRRVGGATYQVPMEVRSDRRISLAIKWIIHYARGRSEKGMVLKLANEIIDAYSNRGASIKKKEDTHRMAEANRAFAHYRW